MNIQIQRFTHYDHDVANQILSLGQECPEFICFWDIDSIDRMMIDHDGICIIARDTHFHRENQVVGFALGTYQPITSKVQWENLFIVPEYRRHGISRMLTVELVAMAWETFDAKLITADVFSAQASKMLREKFQFKHQGSFHYLQR